MDRSSPGELRECKGVCLKQTEEVKAKDGVLSSSLAKTNKKKNSVSKVEEKFLEGLCTSC